MTSSTFSFNKTKTREKALSFFLKIVTALDKHNIPYALEGGTLLGIVRDKQLLPWDHDIDLSIMATHARQLLRLKWRFLWMGFKFSIRKSQVNSGPFKKNDLIIVKIKPIGAYLLKALIPWINTDLIVCDIFVKQPMDGFVYWQAMNKTMRVPEHHYASFETLLFKNHPLKLPNDCHQYLTQKYGNWSVPVKEWSCGSDEKTIWKSDN